jgi:transposase
MSLSTSSYAHFFGIDVGKTNVVVSTAAKTKTVTFPNTQEGFECFYKQYQETLSNGLVVLENTGGYEYALMRFLLQHNVAVHRAHAKQVKAFIASLGVSAKTDSLDAKGLRRYAEERHGSLQCANAVDEIRFQLKALTGRRSELVTMRAQEKNRHQAPGATARVRGDIEDHIAFITQLVERLETDIELLFAVHPDLASQRAVLETVPGIGKATAALLLAEIQELGTLDRGAIAALTGTAPIARESGALKAYRSTWGGRSAVKPTLFIAALAASRSLSPVGDFYRQLILRGKHKMVALIAVMRKIIVIANARLRDHLINQQQLSLVKNN